MATVVLQITPADEFPFERTEIVPKNTSLPRHRHEWPCRKCCSLTSDTHTYRRISTVCDAHKILIPKQAR